MSSILVFALLIASVLASSPCKLGEKTAKGSYYQECLPKFTVKGCYAKWEENEANKYLSHGEFSDRFYKNQDVGFRYKCDVTDKYIEFAPIGCILRKNGNTELLSLGASGELANKQTVKCNQGDNGSFTFEFGDSPSY